MKILNGHTNENNAYIVNDYPYGFTLRTKIRYWIESNNKGDRFCSQTLNPKTNLWNKPKKSTYCSIEILFLDEKNYVKSKAINAGWDDETKLNEFLSFAGNEFLFNDFQKKQIIRIKAIARTQKHLKFECVNSTSWTAEEKQAFDLKQSETKKTIDLLYNHELINAGKE